MVVKLLLVTQGQCTIGVLLVQAVVTECKAVATQGTRLSPHRSNIKEHWLWGALKGEAQECGLDHEQAP